MSIPPRPVHSGTFLVTAVTHNRRRLFQVDTHACLFVATLQHYRRGGRYLLHDFVLMPEHVHLLLTPVDAAVERVVGLIKGGFSHRLDGPKPVWQRGFSDRRTRSREEFLAMRAYILMNPVRKRLCSRPEDWKWSSAWSGWRDAPYPAAKAAEEWSPEWHG